MDDDADDPSITPTDDGADDVSLVTPTPNVPIEEWSIEEPYDSADYLARRGPWSSWVPFAERENA